MILLLNAFFVIVFDQLSKTYIRNTFSEGQSIPIIEGIFHITYIRNLGGAFGLFPDRQLMFLVLSMVVIFLIIVYWWQLGTEGRLMQIALGLELGGVIGNLVDRILTGHVTDFLDFRFWPVFNVADIAIVSGLFFVLFALLRTFRRETRI